MADSESYTDESDQPSVYELLSASERIVDGSVSFDWRKIPVDLIENLPEPDQPSRLEKQRKNRNRKNLRESDHHEFVGDQRVESAQRNPPNDDIHQLPLTFNNCHFHLDGDKVDTERNTKIPSLTNLIAEKMSKLGKQVSNSSEVPLDKSFRSSSDPLKDSYSRLSVSELGHHDNLGFKSKHAFKSIDHNERNCSNHSAKNDEDSFKITEPSDYIRQGMEREKEVLETVHQELSNLSHDLKARSEKLKSESMRLEQMKIELEKEQSLLEKKEKNIKKEAKTLVALNMKKKEEEWKENTKNIVSKYEAALDHLGRENKRLQTSLKDMGKDRNERLKAMLASNTSNAATEQQSQKESESEKIFQQMKKILAIHSAKPLDEDRAEKNTLAKPIAKQQTAVSFQKAVFKLLYFLLNKGGLVTYFDAVYSTYSLIYDQLISHENELERNVNLGVYESYLEFIFHGSNEFSPLEGHQVGELVYSSLSSYLSNTNPNLKFSSKTTLLLYLIPLVTLHQQQEVTDALLDGVLYQTNQYIPARQYLSSSLCLGSIFSLLKRNFDRKTCSDIIASILLTLVSEDDFGKNAQFFMDDLRHLLTLKLSVKTFEALLVIVQKLAAQGQSLTSELLDILKGLHSKHLSDFCDINIKSILLNENK